MVVPPCGDILCLHGLVSVFQGITCNIFVFALFQSTEVPFTQSSLNSASWQIVKEWSEKQLGHQFPSIQTLAYHLILNHSIGRGTEAASKFAYAAELSIKGKKYFLVTLILIYIDAFIARVWVFWLSVIVLFVFF